MYEENSKLEAKRYLTEWNSIDRELSNIGAVLKFITVEKDGVKSFKPVMLNLETLNTNKVCFYGFEFTLVCKVDKENIITFTLKEVPSYSFKNYAEFSKFYKALTIFKDVFLSCNCRKLKVLEYRKDA